jgi:hypothetical protein
VFGFNPTSVDNGVLEQQKERVMSIRKKMCIVYGIALTAAASAATPVTPESLNVQKIAVGEPVGTSQQEEAERKTANISNVAEVLDKHAAHQDKLNSFICKWEASTRMNALLTAPYTALSGRSQKVELIEFRCDGSRYSERQSKWGNIRSAKDFVRKEQGPYNSRLWDGQRFFHYVATTNRPGRLGIFAAVNELPETMQLGHQRDRAGLGALLIRGFYPINDERVDFAIRKAQTVSMGDRTERINGSECYSIVAEDASQKCTLWFDPGHGYNIAKGQIQYKDSNVSLSQENVRFEKIDDCWIVAEAVVRRIQKFWKGNFTDETTVCKLMEMKINPDHERLGSFRPDDILDGTTVLFQGDTWKKTHGHIRTAPDRMTGRMRAGVMTWFDDQGRAASYTWRNGKIVDEDHSLVADFLSKDVRGSKDDAKR